MDLASAVQFLLAYEASLKLAPGQKPPPPSPSVFGQLSQAVAAINLEIESKEPCLRFSRLAPSVWSDWPLCCGLDLTPEELQAARSLPPTLLRDRGLLSVFLALHSCAEGGVDGARGLASTVLLTLAELPSTDEEAIPAVLPSAHLAARVGHRLINADDTLDFAVDDEESFAMWDSCVLGAVLILVRSPKVAKSAVPHAAAGLSLAKEAAVMLDALCAGQLGSRGDTGAGGLSNRLPFLMALYLIVWVEAVLLVLTPSPISEVYNEAASLAAYDPMLLLRSFYRNVDSGLGRLSMTTDQWSWFLNRCRSHLWPPLAFTSFRKLRPADGYTAMRLGLEDVGRHMLPDKGWFNGFCSAATASLRSGLVQPELILRARPQLLEGLVECLAMGRLSAERRQSAALLLVRLLTHSPAVGFHLRKFFSRSGCLQKVRETFSLTPNDSGRELIRLLGPRAAQVDIKPDNELQSGLPALFRLLADEKQDLEATVEQMDRSFADRLCDFIVRDLTLDNKAERLLAQPLLPFLSELAEGIAAPEHLNYSYGALRVVEIGKACLAFSSTVARALKDIEEAGPEGKGGRGPRGAGTKGKGSVRRLRVPLVGMARVLSLLRHRLLHELLPLAEAREGALWEGVREEEVVAALIMAEGA